MKEEKKITVRQAAIQDYEAIKNILISAFGDVEEALLVEKLRHIDTFIPHLSLVALMENRIVGYILFTKILIVDKEKKNESLALAPMAVLPQNQRIGIGSQLIKVGLQKAAKLGYTSVIVWGHKEYYPKFGFQPALLYGIICPLPDKQEYLMALSLKPNGLKNIKGMVLYPKEFGLWEKTIIVATLSFDDYRSNRDPVLDAAINFSDKNFITDPMAHLFDLFQKRNMQMIETATFRFAQDPRYQYQNLEAKLTQAGSRLVEQNQLQNGLLVLDLVTRAYPKSAKAWLALAKGLEKANQSEKAVVAHKKAADL